MEPQPLNLVTTVYVQAAEVDTRLHDLGLRRDILQRAVWYAATFAAECTPHDPKSLAGILMWAKSVRGLRDYLVPHKWLVENPKNLPLIVHPSGAWAIAVESGDKCTGIPNRTPATRYEKGPATRQVVNGDQLTFSSWSGDWAREYDALAMKIWFLLHYWDESTGEIRMELSLPAEIAADGYVLWWKERIMIGPVVDGSLVTTAASNAMIEPDDGWIEVPVLKKA